MSKDKPKTEGKPGQLYYKITINSQPGPGGEEPVDLSVNGRAWRIPRNVESEVPEHVYKALKLCVETRYEPDPSGRGASVRQVQRFPMSVTGPYEKK